ncbi:hypothetical protein XENOCAPTIV_000640, partial [Xenoophorus captivus]
DFLCSYFRTHFLSSVALRDPPLVLRVQMGQMLCSTKSQGKQLILNELLETLQLSLLGLWGINPIPRMLYMLPDLLPLRSCADVFSLSFCTSSPAVLERRSSEFFCFLL